MNEIKKGYDAVRPPQSLVDETKRRMRAEASEKKTFSPWQLIKLLPAACVVALAVMVFAPKAPEKPGDATAATAQVARYSIDPVYEQMLASSGGSVFMKLDACIVGLADGCLTAEIISVETTDNVGITYLPGEKLRIAFAQDRGLAQGDQCTFWLFAESVGGDWQGYECFLKGE